MWKWQYIEHVRHNPDDTTSNSLQSPHERQRLSPHSFTDRLHRTRDNTWGYII